MTLRRRAQALSALFLLISSSVFAGSATLDDYAAANANNTVRALSGSAVLMTDGQPSPGNDGVNDTSYMRLVPNSASQTGFVTNNVTIGGNGNRVLIDFDVRCMNGTATPADGMGIALLNVANHGLTGVVTWPTGEVPSVAGSLGIGLGVYNGGGGGTTMKIYFNSAQVGTDVILSAAPFSYNLYKGTGKTNQFAYDHFNIDVNLAAATLSVTITPNGQAAIPVLTNSPVPGMTPYRWRMGFGARTGGSNAIFDIDNLNARGPTPPTITAPVSLTVAEDAAPQAFTLAVTDPEGGPFTYVVTGPSNGILGGTAPNLTYKPNANYFGADSITVVATDTDGFSSAPFTIPITVTPVNDGPPVANPDSATTTDGQFVTVAVLANDTIVDLPYTMVITTAPKNGTTVINGNNTISYVPTPGFAGVDTFTYRLTDFDGETATAVVTITVSAIPPSIGSPLQVNAISTLLFSYTIVATGTQPVVFTAAPLPPGVTLVGATLQGFIPPGSYAVTLAATNSTGTDIKTLVINSTAVLPATDTDGDGFPDELEVAVGSSPVDPFSTPMTVLKNAAGTAPIGAIAGYQQAKPFFLNRSGLSLRLNFNSKSPFRDSISLTGSLPLAAAFPAQSQNVAVFVGGAGVYGVLNDRGQYTNKTNTVKVKVGRGSTTLAGRNAPFSAKLKGDYAGYFTDEGYVNANIQKAASSVVVYVIVGSNYFSATAQTSYSARLGKSGSARSAR